jgi:CHAT domain-containing protein
MNEDFNPGPISENPPGDPGVSRDIEDPLANALEDLIRERSARTGSAHDDLADWKADRETGSGRAEMGGNRQLESGPESGLESCPEPGQWALLLADEVRPAELKKINAMLAHAAGCTLCAQRLRRLAADASAEESAALAGLGCASPKGRRKLAAELARTPRASDRRPSRLYLWMGAGLAASLLIGLGLMSWWRMVNNPERLMAEAYTQERIFDLRMPGAGFAEVMPEKHLRGGSTGRESAKLLEARARIERHLEAAPEDAHWLQLEARSDILEEKFDPAIDILDRLVAAGPVTASLLLDDASAYFQRGMAAGNENDRTTALDSLRRADELAPGDPVVLFNEAVAMEDRGQLMNAVETWNRYLRFERDPRWLAAGRERLQALEQKLNQLKTHQSRMEQHLATPQAMRALAADTVALGAMDEELSTTLLPRLLDAAFPDVAFRLTPDGSAAASSAANRSTTARSAATWPTVRSETARSRGSPCAENCLAVRRLLYALAASLERHHQDPWLTRLLPSQPLPTDPTALAPVDPVPPQFTQAARALAQAIDADVHGDYLVAGEQSLGAGKLFHALNNAAGEQRADAERADALQATANYAGCYGVAHALLGGDAEFAWIQAEAQALDAYCDPAPGSDAENNPTFLRAESLAHDRRYALVELRVRNMRGGAAVDAGDAESAWRDYMATIREFYAGDYPALRLSGTLSGLEQVEQATPRAEVALLLQQEAVATLELTENRQLLPTARLNLAAAAIRAESLDEAQQAMRQAQSELAANGGGKSVGPILAQVETALANAYLERQEPDQAGTLLDAAYGHMTGERNAVYLRDYAVARGQWALEQGHPETAEPLLRDALLEQERLGGKGGAESIVHAQQNRGLYAVLAGVWLAQGRSGEQVLALWERYRLRILGIAPAACADRALDCLLAKVETALRRPGFDRLLGQVVLPDRLLLYRVSAQGVEWTQVPVRREDVLEAAERLERAVNSPETAMDAVHRASRRAGELLIDPISQSDPVAAPGSPEGHLLLEPDPLLGNLPWPSVATAAGDLGLGSNLEESPSLLLERQSPVGLASAGRALVVGASVASGESQLLPEVLQEARAVARFDNEPSLLVGDQATEPQVMARLATAAAIHFAGHAARRDGGTRLLLAPAQAGSHAAATGVADQDTPWLDSALLRKHPPRAARLAVFSACSSGKTEAGWNHGMGDIVATLAELGVPDVVATRWQIDSGAAVPMMDAFYGGLAKGLTVPQALTAARQTMVRDPRYRHPYYWAAWYASGTGTADLRPIFHSGR